MRVAVIDIGSNSVKLSIGDVEDGHVHIIKTDRVTQQLGSRIEADGALGRDCIKAVAATVGQLATQARLAGARRLDVVGTSASREASDGGALRTAVSAAAGVPMRTLTGDQEAHLLSRSIEVGVGMPLQEAVMFDIGGGSTEVVYSNGGLVTERHSLPIGAVRLTDRLGLRQETALDSEALDALQKAVDEHCLDLPSCGPRARAFGCGGTVTALARLQVWGMPPDDDAPAALGDIDGEMLLQEEVAAITTQLIEATLEARIVLTGLKRIRAEIIPAGAVILQSLLRQLGVAELQVREQGIRLGMLADLAVR